MCIIIFRKKIKKMVNAMAKGKDVQYVTNMDDFETLKEATEDSPKPLVIDFTAAWCPPCIHISPIFHTLVAKYPQINFRKIDVDKCKDIASEANVQAMPTFIVFKNGEEAERMEGANKEALI